MTRIIVDVNVSARINHPFGHGLYQPFMVILGVCHIIELLSAIKILEKSLCLAPQYFVNMLPCFRVFRILLLLWSKSFTTTNGYLSLNLNCIATTFESLWVPYAWPIPMWFNPASVCSVSKESVATSSRTTCLPFENERKGGPSATKMIIAILGYVGASLKDSQINALIFGTSISLV